VISEVQETARNLVMTGIGGYPFSPKARRKISSSRWVTISSAGAPEMEDPLRQPFSFLHSERGKAPSIRGRDVIGMVMGKYPEMKPRAKEATALVKESS
jgi:hypothetical protein